MIFKPKIFLCLHSIDIFFSCNKDLASAHEATMEAAIVSKKKLEDLQTQLKKSEHRVAELEARTRAQNDSLHQHVARIAVLTQVH